MATVVPAGMLMLVALAHPLVADEVDRLAARVVVAAVATPVLLMRRWHIQIDRPTLDNDRWSRHDHRLRVGERRRRQRADVDAAVDARLVDSDRDVGRHGGLR